MESYQQTSARFASSFVESPLSVNSHRGRPADYGSNESGFGTIQHERFPNPENGSGNGNHNYDVGEEEQRQAFVGILDIYVHHARDIHNICIYDKQDVYAKLSLTSNPDGTLSTQIAKGGGRNPVFNESLQLKINSHPDTSLKCEVWMLSRARNYLEDQLLGFALVPLSTVAGKGKVTRDFAMSSTDLFHSLAGIVQLTLTYHGSVPSDYHSQSNSDANLALSPSSISSEVVLLCHGMENPEPTNYNDIEFPDLQVASEDHQMVSEFIKMASDDLKPENSSKRDVMLDDPNENEFSEASFSHLGAFPSAEDDYDMAPNTTVEKCADSSTIAYANKSSDDQTDPDAEHSSFNVVSSTTSSSSEGHCPHDSLIQKDGSSPEPTRFNGFENPSSGASLNENVSSFNKETLSSQDSFKEGEASNNQPKTSEEATGIAFSAPLVSINLEPEQTVVQQQIVDMYMKSMQQFTESLAKMKLPMDIESQGSDDSTKSGIDQRNVQSGRNASSRVFYGSGAFF